MREHGLYRSGEIGVLRTVKSKKGKDVLRAVKSKSVAGGVNPKGSLKRENVGL